MKKNCLIFLVLSSIYSCDQQGGSNSHSQIKPDSVKKEAPYVEEREVGERKTIEKFDTVYLYGGSKRFIAEHFKNDTCTGIVQVEYWFRDDGGVYNEAIIKLKDKVVLDKQTFRFMAFDLYYWNSKFGYDRSHIRFLDHVPDSSEYRRTCGQQTYVDDSVIFRIKKTKEPFVNSY